MVINVLPDAFFQVIIDVHIDVDAVVELTGITYVKVEILQWNENTFD